MDTDFLDDAVKRLVAAANPTKVILFGSQACGTQTPDSDVDLLVLEHEVPSKHHEVVRLLKVLRGFPLPLDLIVMSDREFAERSEIPSTLPYWAKREGRVLYDAP